MKHWLLASTFLLAACSAAQTDSRYDPVAFDPAPLDARLSEAVESGEVIGVSALVWDEGREVYNAQYGLGDRERGTAVTEDTVWRIYSMTKPMTSAVIMQLVEEGKVSLDDPVSKFIPSFADVRVARLGANGAPEMVAPDRPVTVEHLLTHTAGLGYGIFGEVSPTETMYARAELFKPGESLEAKVDRIAALPLLGQPGEQWFYSASIDVLGRIIEVVDGVSLGEAMEARLFGPLGMTETSFRVRPDQKARFVSNYAITPDGSFVLFEDGQSSPFLNDNGFQSGGGGLVSTLGDVAKFAEAMTRGGELGGVRILEEDTVATMMSAQTSPDLPYLQPWIGGETGALFGYGGSVQVAATPEQQREAGRYPGQWGWSGAARTTFYMDPQNDAFGVILLQFFGAEDPQLHDDFQALALEQTRDDGVELGQGD